MAGGGEPAQGNGNSLLACRGVIEAGNHIGGQLRPTDLPVFICNGQDCSGHIQFIPELEVVLLRRLACQGDGLHGDDFHGIIQTHALIGNHQGQFAVVGVVKAADHIPGDGLLFRLAGIVGQRQNAAGYIQRLNKLQVLCLGGLGGKADFADMLLHGIALQLRIGVVAVTGHSPGAAKVKAAVGGLHQHLGGRALGAGVITQIDTCGVCVDVVAVAKCRVAVSTGSQTGFVLADVTVTQISGGGFGHIIAVLHGSAATEVTGDTTAVQAHVIIVHAAGGNLTGVEGIGNAGGISFAADTACVCVKIRRVTENVGRDITVVPAFHDAGFVAAAHNAAGLIVDTRDDVTGKHLAYIIAVGDRLICISHNTAAAAGGRHFCRVIAMADEGVIAAQAGNTAGIMVAKQASVLHHAGIIAAGDLCIQAACDTAQIAHIRFQIAGVIAVFDFAAGRTGNAAHSIASKALAAGIALKDNIRRIVAVDHLAGAIVFSALNIAGNTTDSTERVFCVGLGKLSIDSTCVIAVFYGDVFVNISRQAAGPYP